ncbi:MAG: phytase [candidate division KSB1 bacterium]|nr:phytase [candidate division KSB1 bacterium]
MKQRHATCGLITKLMHAQYSDRLFGKTVSSLITFFIFSGVLLAKHNLAQAQSIPAEISVNPRISTTPVVTDADDPAIWVHPADPSKSLIIGTDKGKNGGLYVWNLQGQQLQYLPLPEANNVDVRYGMFVGGEQIDIAVTNSVVGRELKVYKIDAISLTLTDITTAGGIKTPELKTPYGLCLYRRPHDGAMFVFETTEGGDSYNVHQYRLQDDGAGKVKGTWVRSFGAAYTCGHMEGLVADDELGYIYVADEDCAIRKFYADPDLGNNDQIVAFAFDDGISGDREGLGLYTCADGTGYLLVSSQNNQRAMVYRREGDNGNPHSHSLVTTIHTPNVGGTDGLDVTSRYISPVFSKGLFVKHDSQNKNFALYAWEDIAQTYLSTGEVQADFAGDMLSGYAPLTVNFSDLSTGGPSAWLWDFGDGTTSTEPNPTHHYTASDTYTVKLTVTNILGRQSMMTKAEYIVVKKTPLPDFVANTTTGNVPITIQFSDRSTGEPTSWLWDFGDGSTSTLQHPSHRYTTAGNHTVTLTIQTPQGTFTKTKPNYISLYNITPEFSANLTSGCIPLTVIFTDLSTGPVRTWFWEFGDGTISTARHPFHVYATPGIYTVKLTISSTQCTTSKTKTAYIAVGAIPGAMFTATPTTGGVPLTVNFTDQSSGNPTSWWWDFGDGMTSTLQNPTHQYTKPGTYTVSLTVANACAYQSTTKARYITVIDAVTAEFTENNTSGCAPLHVQFTDQSSGPVKSWLWDFGDGVTSTVKNPSHTYMTAGVYTVTLTVANAAGSRSTKTKTNLISLGVIPTVKFAASPTVGNAPLTVAFTDESTGTSNSSRWLWEFGDGTTSSEQNPSHLYTTPGTYTVTLTVSNPCGAVKTNKTGYITVVGCTPANVAYKKVIRASSSSGAYAPDKAIDGNTSTNWRSTKKPGTAQWLEIDLGAIYQIDNAVIQWEPKYRALDFQFQHWDGATWQTSYSVTNNAQETSTFSFASIRSQRLRVLMTRAADTKYYSIMEVIINGCAATNLPKSQHADTPEPPSVIPGTFALDQNYPNPFNPNTTISFALPEAGKVTLSIYSVTGQLVRTLVDREMPAGWQTVRWNGRDEAGKTVAAGMYLYQIVVKVDNGEAAFIHTKRMTLLK